MKNFVIFLVGCMLMGTLVKAQPIIYAVTTGGNLNWYKHTGYQNGTPDMLGPLTIGYGGWNSYKSVFASLDVIYAISRGGDLLWYKHKG